MRVHRKIACHEYYFYDKSAPIQILKKSGFAVQRSVAKQSTIEFNCYGLELYWIVSNQSDCNEAKQDRISIEYRSTYFAAIFDPLQISLFAFYFSPKAHTFRDNSVIQQYLFGST